MKTFFSCYFIMATRKYKKQRKGNLKKKSLGKKKRSMKKRGKSLKKRGGNGDLIQPLTVTFGEEKLEVTLPWAKYVNPLYNSLNDLQSEKKLSIDIAQMYQTRIDQIYFLDNNRRLIDNFSIYSALGVEKCDKIVDSFTMDTDTKLYKSIVCQAIKIRIYNDIMKQIGNMVNSFSLAISPNSPNINYYYCKNIREIRRKNTSVEPIFDIPNREYLGTTYNGIKGKFHDHVERFIKIGGIEKYIKYTIPDNGNIPIRGKIIREILGNDNIIFNYIQEYKINNFNKAANLYTKKGNTNIEGENPMSSSSSSP